ncbi:hypothetical protein HAX54_035925 [Datura stramonium]|uniref:Uncharacterized protein n=1 Tax=Datura stramonium TaxID=4076 RepID=A0ABS8VHF8_DATST|nr:hypothetical protein [Datura stramonium]
MVSTLFNMEKVLLDHKIDPLWSPNPNPIKLESKSIIKRSRREAGAAEITHIGVLTRHPQRGQKLLEKVSRLRVGAESRPEFGESSRGLEPC